MAEIRRKDSALIGTISHEAANYGSHLVPIGLALLNGSMVPPYNYVEHRVVTRKNGKI